MSKKLWGTRFKKKTNVLTDRFTSSIAFDSRLAKYDIMGSIAHARMLARQGIIPQKDGSRIISGLRSILKDVLNGKFKFDPSAEDIHSNIQDILDKRCGEPAHKLHTARSRNDQIALDTRLYLRDEVDNLGKLISDLQNEHIVNLSRQYKCDHPRLYSPAGGTMRVTGASSFGLRGGVRQGQAEVG